MGYIVDISKYQSCKRINWPTFSNNVDLLIIRVQYGSSGPDPEYNDHVSCAKQYGIPFMTYAFPAFISTDDARVEARDAAARQDKESLALCIDIESEFDKNGNPVGITRFSNQERLEGLKAYVDELRKQGIQKVGAYVAHNVYRAWWIEKIISLFDFVWIPRYGVNNGQQNTKPDFPCDIWQYTSVGRLPGYDGNLDLNVLTGSKLLEWFTGAQVKEPAGPHVIMHVKALCQTDIRTGPSHTAGYVRDAVPNEVFDIYQIVNKDGTQWHCVGGDTVHGEFWIDGNNGSNLYWLDNPALKQQSAQTATQAGFHKVVSGDTVSKLASKYGSTLAQIKTWNDLDSKYTIYAGKSIRVK
jgi:GH25 family lysozyme M1 (1,4-beta-N-acetylmuramidase)